jgi:hypothetical protein
VASRVLRLAQKSINCIFILAPDAIFVSVGLVHLREATYGRRESAGSAEQQPEIHTDDFGGGIRENKHTTISLK